MVLLELKIKNLSIIPNYGSTLRFLFQLRYWDLMIWIIGVSEKKNIRQMAFKTRKMN